MTIFLQKLVRFSKPFQNVKNVKSSKPWAPMTQSQDHIMLSVAGIPYYVMLPGSLFSENPMVQGFGPQK